MAIVNPGLYNDRQKQDFDAIESKPYKEAVYYKFDSSLRTKQLLILKKDFVIAPPIILNIEDAFAGGANSRLQLGFPGTRNTAPQFLAEEDVFRFNLGGAIGPYIITTTVSTIFVGTSLGAILKKDTPLIFSLKTDGGRPTRGSGYIILEYINMQRVPGYRK